MCEFNQLLTSEEMILPVVMDQVPDIMVHILRGKDKDIQQVAFARFKAKDVMAGNFMEPAKWIYFQEDKVKRYCTSDAYEIYSNSSLL